MRCIAGEVNEKPVHACPSIRLSAEKMQQKYREYYQGLGKPISPQASDLVDLATSVASVLSPLYEDIHSTFATRPNVDERRRQTSGLAAQS
jgi:hypothetical protein